MQPSDPRRKEFAEPNEALAYLRALYQDSVESLRAALAEFISGKVAAGRVRAFYPYLRLRTELTSRPDSRRSFGFVAGPGVYETTLTRPDLFGRYFSEQLRLLVKNHAVKLEVGLSTQPIPIHFALSDEVVLDASFDESLGGELGDHFDLPNLATMDDTIANGSFDTRLGEPHPLALFTAPRVDYSLHRLRHYTGTSPGHFQNFVLFTNYQFYIDEFIRIGRERVLAQGPAGPDDYVAFVEPGNRITWNPNHQDKYPSGAPTTPGTAPARLPQMPAYHLQRADRSGITMVNIGIGPSNARTITDHIAVLRPHAWLMLGHCAGLRNTQRLGDYVLAHGYVREDHVLDDELPLWVPIPALAEVQLALEGAVADVTQMEGYDLKRVMRTGTVASVDNRNWELQPHADLIRRFNLSRAVALDMESATIAANGFRFRVPYGTLLCVSDKPLHGELKLAGMASRFYRERVNQHLEIGIRALDALRRQGVERLHSRKLRSFAEVAFQ
ncbi:MAG TPA: AMP nucleosidase [Lautropia sp.]|nr:AMP nucleosidase [Lautropia sp.]